jgi:hypothetical protein
MQRMILKTQGLITQDLIKKTLDFDIFLYVFRLLAVTIAIQRAKKLVVLPEQAGSLVIKRKLSKFECNFGLDFSIF